jgi:hypothetical protein
MARMDEKRKKRILVVLLMVWAIAAPWIVYTLAQTGRVPTMLLGGAGIVVVVYLARGFRKIPQ